MSSKPNERDWQQDFVATNLLAIGYNAWAGYLGGERGVVVCDLNTPSLGMSGATYKTYFIPRRRLAAFLNAWLAAPDTVILQHHHMNSHILQAVDTYNPLTDAIVLLESDQQASFLYLQKLPILPSQCYETVCKAWTEFQPQATDLFPKRLQQT